MIIRAVYDGPPYWGPMPQPMCSACQRQELQPQLTGTAPTGSKILVGIAVVVAAIAAFGFARTR